MITYFPYGVCLYLTFLLASFILMPFAYLKGMILFPKTAKRPENRVPLAMAWLFFGILILVYFFILDSIRFFSLLYKKSPSMSKRYREATLESQGQDDGPEGDDSLE